MLKCAFLNPLSYIWKPYILAYIVAFINHIPDNSNQFVESLVYVHTDFGWSLHICDLQLSGQLLTLFLGYLREKEEQNKEGLRLESKLRFSQWKPMFDNNYLLTGHLISGNTCHFIVCENVSLLDIMHHLKTYPNGSLHTSSAWTAYRLKCYGCVHNAYPIKKIDFTKD